MRQLSKIIYEFLESVSKSGITMTVSGYNNKDKGFSGKTYSIYVAGVDYSATNEWYCTGGETFSVKKDRVLVSDKKDLAFILKMLKERIKYIQMKNAMSQEGMKAIQANLKKYSKDDLGLSDKEFEEYVDLFKDFKDIWEE